MFTDLSLNRQQMKQILLLLTFALYSCNSPLDGSIEERENKKLYLVNKSKDKIMAFTVKCTVTKNDSIYDYATEVMTLQPGAEKFLTEKQIVVKGKEIINLVPVDDSDLVKQQSKIKVTNIKVLESIRQPDTIYQFKCEVTGQREIKLK